MGEIADDHYADLLDDYNAQLERDEDAGFIHRYGSFSGRRSRVYGPPLKCARCGAGDVYWQRVYPEYQLYDIATVAKHQCPSTNNPEGFDDVP